MATATRGREIYLPAQHRGQQIVRSQMQRLSWLCAGRRWRKTTLAMPWVVAETLEHGGDYIWGAPTFKQVRVGWDELRRAAGDVLEFNESRMTVTTPRGDVGHYVSLDDPDNARGLTARRAVIDEAGDVAAKAWYEVIRPMLIDTHGDALVMGTPKGRNWFWIESVKAEDRSDSIAWQVPTKGAAIVDGVLNRAPHPMENPQIPWSEIQQLFETMPERAFRQEILAEWLSDGGSAFRNVDLCVSGALLDKPPHPQTEYVMGVDLAKHEDFTVVCVADKRTKTLVAFERWQHSDWPLTKRRIYDLAARWNNALCWVDATGVGDPIFDDLHRAGVRISPYRFTGGPHGSRQQLLENAILLVEQQSVHFPRIDVLLNELKAMQPVRQPSGLTKYMVPDGMHDDCIMAFALMAWPLANAGGGMANWGTEWMSEIYNQPATEIGGIRLLQRNL